MNAAAERLFGYTGMELIGKPLALLAPGGLAARRLPDAVPLDPIALGHAQAVELLGPPPER